MVCGYCRYTGNYITKVIVGLHVNGEVAGRRGDLGEPRNCIFNELILSFEFHWDTAACVVSVRSDQAKRHSTAPLAATVCGPSTFQCRVQKPG